MVTIAMCCQSKVGLLKGWVTIDICGVQLVSPLGVLSLGPPGLLQISNAVEFVDDNFNYPLANDRAITS